MKLIDGKHVICCLINRVISYLVMYVLRVMSYLVMSSVSCHICVQPEATFVNLHVRGTGEDVVDCAGDILTFIQSGDYISDHLSVPHLGLEAGDAVVDGGHLVGVVGVHGRLELCLDQTWSKNNYFFL